VPAGAAHPVTAMAGMAAVLSSRCHETSAAPMRMDHESPADAARGGPQREDVDGMGRRNPTGSARAFPLIGLLLAAPLAVGCGADAAGDAPSSQAATGSTAKASAAVPPAPADLEVIAQLTGCKPEMRGRSAELSQAVCKTLQGTYMVTTFPEERFKLTWLQAAKMSTSSDGTFLVGPRWTIGANPQVLKRLQPMIGGELQHLRGATSAPRSTGSPSGP